MAAQKMINADIDESRIKYYMQTGDICKYSLGIAEEQYIHDSSSYAARILLKCGIKFNVTALFPILQRHTGLIEKREKLKQKLYNTCHEISAIEMDLGYYTPTSYDEDTLSLFSLSEIQKDEELKTKIISNIAKTPSIELKLKDKEDMSYFEKEKSKLDLEYYRELKNYENSEMRYLEQERKINLSIKEAKFNQEYQMQKLIQNRIMIENEFKRLTLEESQNSDCNIL